MARIETYVWKDMDTLVKEVYLDNVGIPTKEREVNLIGNVDQYLLELLGQRVDGVVKKVFDPQVGTVNIIHDKDVLEMGQI